MLTYVRDLGPGAFGIAKLYKTQSGDPVCVKEVHYPRDPETRKQVLNEVRSMESCVHPNVVTFLDSWVTGTRLCIMMEYCSNGSLNTLIQKQARRGTHFPLIKITHYLQELADALRYCHEELRMVSPPGGLTIRVSVPSVLLVQPATSHPLGTCISHARWQA